MLNLSFLYNGILLEGWSFAHDRWKAARLATDKVNNTCFIQRLASGPRSEYCNHSWSNSSWVPACKKGCNGVSEIRPLLVLELAVMIGWRIQIDWILHSWAHFAAHSDSQKCNSIQTTLLLSCWVSVHHVVWFLGWSFTSLPHHTRPCWDAEFL